MALQNEKADAKLAVRVIKFLNHPASREAALCNPIRDVLSKWVDGNAIVNAIFNNNGGFFDKVRQIALSPTLSNQQPSEDHVYVGSEPILFSLNYLDNRFFWPVPGRFHRFFTVPVPVLNLGTGPVPVLGSWKHLPVRFLRKPGTRKPGP